MKTLEIALPPEIAFDEANLKNELTSRHGLSPAENYRLLKRSIDARGKNIKVNLTLAFYSLGQAPPIVQYQKDYKNVRNSPEVIIVGAGPAGLFAALRLIEHGYKPIILERGKDVRSRRRDLAAINKDHIVNPDSNYCFGEGGAGTYSDGKLYTRSKKRGDVRRILEIFVAHGAKDDILADAHPHIGTNKLPEIITNIRESILEAGGEIHFNSRLTDLTIKNNEIIGVSDQNGQKYTGMAVILATGHSARDIFYLLNHKKIHIESKPFALGVRIEHKQSLIDQIQYHCENRGEYLPASAYSLVSQVDYKGSTRGVFSFCMCPGGFIVPSATAPGEIVVNGMSPSRRNSKFANSGLVVSVEQSDLEQYMSHGPLAALEFQKTIEQKACAIAGSTQVAPAQLMMDFVNKKASSSLLETSYQPGLTPVIMDEILPPFIAHRLRESFKDFGKKMRGYLTNDAQIVGVESRTSSPVKIPRDTETLEHTQIKRLYPCGEGAGYAGGIVSAAMDGERCALQFLFKYGKIEIAVEK